MDNLLYIYGFSGTGNSFCAAKRMAVKPEVHRWRVSLPRAVHAFMERLDISIAPRV